MNPELESAKDLLWKFQLRREHAQLRKDVDTLKERAEEGKAANTRLEEQYFDLKEQFTGVKCTLDKVAKESLKQKEEGKELRKALDEKIAELDNIKEGLKAQGVQIAALEHEDKSTAEPIEPTPPTLAQEVRPTTTATTEMASRARRTRRTSSLSTIASNLFLEEAVKPIAKTGLRKSQRQAQREPRPQDSATVPPQPLPAVARPRYTEFPYPPLNQDEASLSTYFAALDAISHTINPAQVISLVAMFITGLAQRDQQDTIVDELERRNLCRVVEDGNVNVDCQWVDLKTVVGGLGLLPAGERAEVIAGPVREAKRSHKKKRKR